MCVTAVCGGCLRLRFVTAACGLKLPAEPYNAPRVPNCDLQSACRSRARLLQFSCTAPTGLQQRSAIFHERLNIMMLGLWLECLLHGGGIYVSLSRCVWRFCSATYTTMQKVDDTAVIKRWSLTVLRASRSFKLQMGVWKALPYLIGFQL